MPQRPKTLNLSNWRLPPNHRWAFHHVREIIPSEAIRRGDAIAELPRGGDAGLAAMELAGPGDETWSLDEWLQASNTDALLVAKNGELVYEWYIDPAVEIEPHIVFSVSKSMTATLAGVLVGQGLLDPACPVTDYIPELADSGYADASVQQVLDMAVRIDFVEDYLATEGRFVEYRTATAWHPCETDAIDQNLHDFLCTLGRVDGAHGEVFQYKSPNSDLLGWILERVSEERFARLFSHYLWAPMGAEAEAYITVDRKGGPRTAGGICVRPRDLLRFGELVRNRGFANGQQIVPPAWIDDCSQGGNRDAWRRGESAKEFPDGRYRNKWYQTGDAHQTMLAIGIHSQWIYIDPVAAVTIVKLSSQDEPLKLEFDSVNLGAFARIAAVA